ncbi:MAG TPA: acetyl-CoA carboxylase biotin carboxyl carrier protein [Terriglobales bacterium]|jgi:acetyl-CoA carboxylase biotin carboxyl carrier protein|nr:acetyl-CoA carboxylase biotin carboxyl carrier protein [Terriglobales bacterium]
MNQKEIKELIELLVEKDITEFELERGDIKVHVKRGNTGPPVVHVAPAVAAAPQLPLTMAAPVAPPPAAPAAPSTAKATPEPVGEAAADADLHIVKSPIVGTYYEAPSPGTPPFVKLGDTVKEGQVLCIIEAMKLMNEIESEVSGVVAKMFVSNGSPVEYGMALFGIRRS